MTEYKKLLRKELRDRVLTLDEEYLRFSDAGIYSYISTLPQFLLAPVIFAFYSVGREVNTLGIIELCIELGKTLALPVVLGNGVMEFAAYSPETDLVNGQLGIPEPYPKAQKLIPRDGDLIIVPGISYDKNGFRLGQGGGYYDRMLALCDAFSVGLCRDRMMEARLPREEHDIPVKCIITESGIIKPSPA